MQNAAGESFARDRTISHPKKVDIDLSDSCSLSDPKSRTRIKVFATRHLFLREEVKKIVIVMTAGN